jgi:DivIVA domain-containing protein
MMWFFAVLIVLAMGGVAAVAAGYGRPMPEVYDDRPDALVPSGRALRGDDLRRVRFSTALTGYRMSEVDALLDRLATELDERTRADEASGEGTQSQLLDKPPARHLERPLSSLPPLPGAVPPPAERG